MRLTATIRHYDPFPALKGGVPWGLGGYLPFVGATLLCSTMKESGFLITNGMLPTAFFIMFKAPFTMQAQVATGVGSLKPTVNSPILL